MLPLTTNWPCHTKVSFCGGFKSFSPYCMIFDANYNNFDRVILNCSSSVHLDVVSFTRKTASCPVFNYIGNNEQFVPMGTDSWSLYKKGLSNSRQCVCRSYLGGGIDEPHYLGSNDFISVENTYNPAADDQLVNFLSNPIDNTEVLPVFADGESITSYDAVQTVSNPVTIFLKMDANSASFLETKFSDVVSKLSDSATATFDKGGQILNSLFDSVTLSLTTTLAKSNQAVDNSINEITYFIKKSGGSAESQLVGLSSELHEASGKAGLFALDVFYKGGHILNSLFDSITLSLTTTLNKSNQAVDYSINEITSFIKKSGGSSDNQLAGSSSELHEVSGKVGLFALNVLRCTIIVVEASMVEGYKIAGYAYSFVKEFLPPEFQEALSLSEENIRKVFDPVGTVFQQVYMAVEGFEESLGLDPNDPLVPFFLFITLSGTFWVSYRIVRYSGYAGDLSPQSALELLHGNENAVLVDIRPENLKVRDGVPDLRWVARFRYASVTPPEIDDSMKRLLKGGRDIEDTLLAAVIRNLKIVDDRSKVLVMDTDGTRSKGVARSLRKLGTKKPYLVQGGFRSWVKNGFHIKMLKSETALTIINEEAEAILDEIRPTPLKMIGYGVGFAAATYSVVEWEKTLQFIGVIALGQSLYRRVASYRDVEDLKRDVRLLLTPVRLGSRAISWAPGKLGSNGDELLTSPSSSDIQSRVLQAAAKHEAQHSDDEDSDSSD